MWFLSERRNDSLIFFLPMCRPFFPSAWFSNVITTRWFLFFLVIFYFVVFFSFCLRNSFFSNQKQTRGGSEWEGRWGGVWRSRGRGNRSQDLLSEKICISNKMERMALSNVSREYTIMVSPDSWGWLRCAAPQISAPQRGRRSFQIAYELPFFTSNDSEIFSTCASVFLFPDTLKAFFRL